MNVTSPYLAPRHRKAHTAPWARKKATVSVKRLLTLTHPIAFSKSTQMHPWVTISTLYL